MVLRYVCAPFGSAASIRSILFFLSCIALVLAWVPVALAQHDTTDGHSSAAATDTSAHGEATGHDGSIAPGDLAGYVTDDA
ncbi:MAG: hypothetical protein ABIF77_08410, partial [bacterium]